MFGARGIMVLGCAVAAMGFLDCAADDPPAPSPASNAVGLRDGGAPGFERELERARGRPLVVNQRASWCGPCRDELPLFQQLAERYRGRVAFLGVNSQDSREEAKKFFARYPTPSAHFFEPDARIARTFRGGRAWPKTAFYTADGELIYTKQGKYRALEDLDGGIRRYAIDG